MEGLVVHVGAATLYQRITEELLAKISSGELKPGDRLPTEEELCAEYGVSRITVRRAVADLVAQRLIVRRRGAGTYVTGREPGLREFQFVGFLDKKLAFDSRLLFSRSETASDAVAAALGLAAGAAVRRIRSVVHRTGEPFTVADAFTVDEPGVRLTEQDYASAQPSVHAMAFRLGRRIERAEQELDATAADAEVAEHLELASGTPVIRARRTYFAQADRPVQYLVIHYHPTRYRFVVDLVPRTGASMFEARPKGRGAARN